jgi:hypothetical protein
LGYLPIHTVSDLVAEHGSGTGEEGRCPAISAGRLRVREPEAGSSWRDAGQARCLRNAASGSGRRCVRRGSAAAGLPRASRG